MTELALGIAREIRKTYNDFEETEFGDYEAYTATMTDLAIELADELLTDEKDD